MLRRNQLVTACFACAISIWGISCSSPSEVQAVNHATPYFSLEDYFRSEAARLQQLAPTITKTVSKNGETEQRSIRIDDWLDELALFIDSDINKPAWQNSYRIDSTKTSVTYTSLDRKLRTGQITVEKRPDGTIKHIGVANRVDNMLFQTNEQLDYYPDSLYSIIRQQQVRIIGESQYTVTGTTQ